MVQAPSEGEDDKAWAVKDNEGWGYPEKDQNLIPRRYMLAADNNRINGKRLFRTTFYTQLGEENMDDAHWVGDFKGNPE